MQPPQTPGLSRTANDQRDDSKTPMGVVLCVTPVSRRSIAFSSLELDDIKVSWSRNDTFQFAVQGDRFVGDLAISNLGVTPSAVTSLRLVAWALRGGNAAVGTWQVPGVLRVPGRTTIKTSLSFGPEVFGASFASPGEVTHIFAIVEDPVFDPQRKDQVAEDFWKESQKGIQYAGTHPAKRSRRITCWSRSEAFKRLDGNRIMLQVPGVLDIAVASTDAGMDAKTGLEKPKQEEWIGSLKTAPTNRISAQSSALPAGEITVYLEVSGTKLLSTLGDTGGNPGCRWTLVDQGNVVRLQWNDSDTDDDYDDFVVHVIHR